MSYGKETIKFIQKIHPVEMGLLPVAFKTQHTVPRLMGGFANADARGLLDSCHHSAFEANMQKEKHPSSMSKNTYLYIIYLIDRHIYTHTVQYVHILEYDSCIHTLQKCVCIINMWAICANDTINPYKSGAYSI